MVEAGRSRELVLPPGTYAFVLDSTKGKVSTYVGPYKNSLSETDQLVVWDSNLQRYRNVDTTDQAIQTWPLAVQGQYIVLANPAGDAHPPKGQSTEGTDLEVGRRVIVPGPVTFPLFPGQTAETIEGHHLRHNQFVIVRVYDEEQAQANWKSAVMAPQVAAPTPVAITTEPAGDKRGNDPHEGEIFDTETRTWKKVGGTAENAPTPVAIDAPTVEVTEETEFTMGQLIVIPGTKVSFYMPSTGMEVVPEDDATGSLDQRHLSPRSGQPQYVRNAVTLETLEYCILLDENGQKRYVRGPAVVFPNPTERFLLNDEQSRIFDAIELNEQTGLYVKVIEEYDDARPSGEVIHHPVGEELFITGKEQAIYFPRAEHSIITYSGKRKHHAIAVPAGEGRYVLNRNTGSVDLETGPTMLLPDPRSEVIVRRILEPHDVQTMFPGNQEALEVNLGYASERQESADYLQNAEMRRSPKGGRSAFAGNESPLVAYAGSPGGQSFMGDTLSRGTAYSPPRTITLDTKYEGAVAISIWPGYAVLVSNKTGNRHVEVGPKVVLLDYDETIMTLSLSTGRPKTDKSLVRTGYLRIINNVVSDLVEVETRDLVSLQIGMSYRVNFEGDTPAEQQRWFDIENYVQILTDHCRSRLRNLAKRTDIMDFYTDAIDLIRDTLLGVQDEEGVRPGLPFPENGMRVHDVEVLSMVIDDAEVETLLVGAQSKALQGAIELNIARQTTTRQKELEELRRADIIEVQKTVTTEAQIAVEKVSQKMDVRLAELGLQLRAQVEQEKLDSMALVSRREATDQEIELLKERDEVELARFSEETDQLVKRMGAMQPGLINALNAFADRTIAERIVTAIGPAALAAGVTSADMLHNLFKGTEWEGALEKLTIRPLAPASE